MSRTVVFLDTSVLVEILGVPGKSQQAEAVRSELRDRTVRGESMILPTAAIIETGKHIAQLPSGADRRRLAEHFVALLEATTQGHAPWTLNGARWDADLIASVCGGVRGCPPLPEMASQGIGAGDVSILAEADAYARRLRAWAAEHADVLRAELGEQRALYGEWLRRRHAVPYTALPDTLVGFDVLDLNEGFLLPRARDAALARLGLSPPPVRLTGRVGSIERLSQLLGTSAFAATTAEGIVVRPIDGSAPRLAKLVDARWRGIGTAAWVGENTVRTTPAHAQGA